MERLRAAFEIACLLGLALLGVCLLPVFCVIRACKGDALWFLPTRTPGRTGKGGHWDHL